MLCVPFYIQQRGFWTAILYFFGIPPANYQYEGDIHKRNYTDSGLLEVNTLENAIYMVIKNDLSFVEDSQLSLYEHHSIYSPNLPMRMLLYLVDLYADITKNENLYGKKKAKIPLPHFIIFYV